MKMLNNLSKLEIIGNMMKKLLYFVFFIDIFFISPIFSQNISKIQMKLSNNCQNFYLLSARQVSPEVKERIQSMKNTQPWIGIIITNLPDNSQIKGAKVQQVLKNSPAEIAGINNGDIIIELADRQISSVKEVFEIMHSLNVDTEYPVVVLRNNIKLVLKIKPVVVPSQTLAENSPKNNLFFPMKNELIAINTLKYALIDQKTHTITFIGSYDPTYATGDIPYEDILKDLLENPYPSVSIEPTPQEDEILKKVDQLISQDLKKMEKDPAYTDQEMQKLANLLLKDPTLETDNRRFFNNIASAVGMTGDEFKRLYRASIGEIDISESELFQLGAKLLKGAGAPEAANGLIAITSGNTPEERLSNMAKALNIYDKYHELDKKILFPEEFRKEAIILCISELCRKMDAPENEIQKIISSIRSGRQPVDTIIDYMGKRFTFFISEKMGEKMLNGLVLGPKLISKLYNLPIPQSELVFKNVKAGSPLGEILFKADYRLKNITNFPDVKEKFPEHLTEMEFIQKEEKEKNHELPFDIGATSGHTLVPGYVDMKISKDGSIIVFEKSEVKIVGFLKRTFKNQSSATTNFLNETAKKYGEFLTQNYDEYAKIFPEFHIMREVAKLVCLARWAKQNNYTINVLNTSSMYFDQPKNVNGFWAITLQITNGKGSMILIQSGGASFGQEEGEEWMKIQTDVNRTSDVLKQLAGSVVLAEQAVNSAINGNLEDARDLAERSARAMTGEIDLSNLPPVPNIPMPNEAALYAITTKEAISQISECFETISSVNKDLQYAETIITTSPDKAEEIKEKAIKSQNEAIKKLQQIRDNIIQYKNNPYKAPDLLITLKNNTIVNPIKNISISGQQDTKTQNSSSSISEEEKWEKNCVKWAEELDKVNKEISSTREALLKLIQSSQLLTEQFKEIEKEATEKYENSINRVGDLLIDIGIEGLQDRYETIYKLAKKLPDKPDELIEKYKYTCSLIQSLKETKEIKDFVDLSEKDPRSFIETLEIIKDGISQINGLLELDKTVPGAVWKYLSITADTTYDLTEQYYMWKNIILLEKGTDIYSESIKKLTNRLQELQTRAAILKQKINSEN